ncbi:MAG TPA: FG-GAP repeat protein, partial [Rhodanobacteraceae bacterium]|nr:FG-GAP repeat protein [Rhodanobacteraceae bacterium]
MNYVVSRFSGRAVVLFMLAAVVPSLAFADLIEEQKLTPTANAGALAGNGAAISDDGAVAVVGAPGDEAAYIYTRSGTTWTKVATLTADDTVVGDHFGASVSISGNSAGANVAVGAPDRGSSAGAVYVYSGSDAIWTQKTSPPLTSALTAAGHLGTSVSIQGLRIAAGAPNATAGRGANAGIAIVFDFDNINNVFTSTSFR